MRRIRPFLVHAVAWAVVPGAVVLPVLTSATTASAATPTCTSTSLVEGAFGAGNTLRVPTAGSGTGRFDCLLGVGDSSTAVGRLQIDLNDCYGDNLTVDNDYGPLTEAAVKRVQRLEGITQDGVYGPHTVDGFDYQLSGQPAGNCDRIDGA
jgi:peptidoglycan hydrolase-like protein with peptidoglycan-binding domain